MDVGEPELKPQGPRGLFRWPHGGMESVPFHPPSVIPARQARPVSLASSGRLAGTGKVAEMSVFDWDPSWDTGVADVDHQHRELLRQMERMMTALVEGRQAAETERTILMLGDYIETHFRTEEDLMARSGYPGLAVHRAVHDGMRAQVIALAATYQRNPAEVPGDVMDFLTSWLVDHMTGEDLKMALHLRGQAEGRSRS